MNISFKKSILAAQLVLIALISLSNVRAAGEVDPAFNAAVQETTLGSVERILVQPDGKLLVVGNFTVAGNEARSNIARLNADGTIDSTFNPPDFYRQLFGFIRSLDSVYIRAVAVQPDGKILVGGDFSGVNDLLKPRLLRLNADGSLDPTFNTALADGPQNANVIYDIKVQTDNRILFSGVFSITQNGTQRTSFARLNNDGSLDASFTQAITNDPIISFAIQPDGKTVYSASNSTNGLVRRANLDGTLDASFSDALFAGFGSQGPFTISRVVLQPDGKVLVGGFFTTANGFPQNSLSRLNTDGSVDTAFNPGGSGTGASNRVSGIAVLPDGKIAIGGTFDFYNSVQRRRNARLNADGSLDTSFNNTFGTATIILNDVQSLGDGRVVTGGSDSFGNFDKLARFNADGSLDATFSGAVYQRGAVYKLLTQPDGKVLVGGSFKKINGTARANFARLNQDGSLETNFVANTLGGTVTSIGLQADGKIVIGGTFSSVNGASKNKVARLNSDGSVDASFTSPPLGGAYVEEVAVLADGKIIVAGTLGAINGVNSSLIRLTTTGAVDTTFVSTIVNPTNNAGFSAIKSLEIQSDGKIVIVGAFSAVNGTSRGRIARLNANGILDNTFNTALGANNTINDLAIQSDGKIVVGGEFLAVNGGAIGTRPYLARLLPDGTFDNSFTATANNYVQVLERQSDDKILVGGLFTQINGVARDRLARLNADGSFDNSFAATGANDVIRDIKQQPDGKILIGGEFTRLNGVSRVSIARLLNAPVASRTRFDFDGDGKADIAVFRPSNGFWYILPSQTNGFYGFPFGQVGDQIAPADYDGDGKTDIAVWRGTVPGAGNSAYFYITNSADNTFRAAQFGATGDIPVSGDWDGDGRADLAVYREGASGGQSFFYYRPSSQQGVNFNTIALGTAGDKPLVGDFDGDGKLDAAVFRASTATWIILRSSDGVTTQTNFGLSTDIPTPADFDGDGTANIAVFRPSNGTWFTSTNPANNYGAIQFGTNGDVPVAADYDGDGRADVAVFRPSNGAWYLNRSTQGFTGVSFGSAEDKSVPNAYIR